MSPYEHGEVYVLADGGEVDLDLGNYERFLDVKLTRDNNITTGIGVAQARGVLLLSAEQHGVPIYEYSPSQVKQAVVGYGKAEKRQVMDMTRRLLNLKAVPRPDDAADAVAIALCHARSFTSRLQSPDAARPGSGRYAVHHD